MFKMNFCQRRLPAYETYRPRFDATRKALCIACIAIAKNFPGYLSQVRNTAMQVTPDIPLGHDVTGGGALLR